MAQRGNEVLHFRATVKSVLLETVFIIYNVKMTRSILVGVLCITYTFLKQPQMPTYAHQVTSHGIIPFRSVAGLVTSSNLFAPITRKTE